MKVQDYSKSGSQHYSGMNQENMTTLINSHTDHIIKRMIVQRQCEHHQHLSSCLSLIVFIMKSAWIFQTLYLLFLFCLAVFEKHRSCF